MPQARVRAWALASTSQTPPVWFFYDGGKKNRGGATAAARKPGQKKQLRRRRWQRGFIVYTAGACACVGFVASTSQTPPVLFFNDGEKPKQNGAAAPARQPRPKTQLRRRRWQRGCISYAATRVALASTSQTPPSLGLLRRRKKLATLKCLASAHLLRCIWAYTLYAACLQRRSKIPPTLETGVSDVEDACCARRLFRNKKCLHYIQR